MLKHSRRHAAILKVPNVAQHGVRLATARLRSRTRKVSQAMARKNSTQIERIILVGSEMEMT